MNRFVELLSGAGNFEAAKAAIAGGCDAIYLGLKNYGARRMADNFSMEDLEKTAKLARQNRKKIYLTVNTVIKDCEVKDFIASVARALDSGADALIMQDYGMISLVSSAFRDVKIHASTQMNIHNVPAVERLKSIGVERVILSRECELSEIEAICSKKIMDVETFVYGALCSAVSGVCYMSSFNNNRSGNRGVCTQMCRLKYRDRNDNEKYFLSTKDFCALSHLKKLYDMGVSSFKIEGRNRSEAYIYNVTSVFREAIDLIYAGKFDRDAVDRLTAKASMTYNRKLTPAYLASRKSADIIFSERNANNGLLISDKIIEFDPRVNSMKAAFKMKFNKSDLLEFENDRYERVSVKIDAIKNKSDKVVFDAPAHETVSLAFKQIKKSDELVDLTHFLPRKIYLTHSQEASSVKSVKAPDSALQAPLVDSSKRPIEVDVKFSEGKIVCDIYCRLERFRYKLEDVQTYKAEKQPLGEESVRKTFLAYNHDKFYLAERGLDLSVKGDIFIPLSLLKKYGKTIFEKFEKDFSAFEAKTFDSLMASLDVTRTAAPLPAEELKPAAAEFRLMLFDGVNADINELPGAYSEFSLHYYYILWLFNNGRLEEFFEQHKSSAGCMMIELPPVAFQSKIPVFTKIVESCVKHKIGGFIVNNSGQLDLIKKIAGGGHSAFKITAGAALNIVNRFSAEYFSALDAADEICLSYELNDSDIVEFLEFVLNSKPDLMSKIRVRLYGNINVANFAYDFFRQNDKYIRTRYAGSEDRQYKFDKLSFKNAVHYMLAVDDETTCAFSGGLLNMCPYIQKYMRYGINKFDISLFNYSDYFKKDLAEITDYIKSVKTGFFSDKIIEERGIVKDMTLL